MGELLDKIVAELKDGLGELSQEAIDHLDEEEHARNWAKWLNNPYCFWLLFLEMAEGYGPGHHEWAIFGDLKSKTFPAWFRYDHDRVFGDGLGGAVRIVHDIEDAHHHLGRALISINCHSTIKEIVSDLESRVLPLLLHQVKTGRPSVNHPKSKAVRKFCQRPDVLLLQKIWYVHSERKRDPALTPYELHVALHEWRHINDPYKILPNDSAAVIASKKEQASMAASRLLYQARLIMEGVAVGEFPRTGNKKKASKLLQQENKQ